MREQLSVIESISPKNIGTVKTVLCEGFDPVSESYFGRTYAQAPDIDGKVFFFSKIKHRVGAFVEVEIMDTLDDYDLSGRAL